jgi:dethiobiotin synthetase
MGRIIFITGTGTGVGKTVLTALLLRHLRQEEGGALAMKPFCSGSREDARLLHRLQEGELSLEEINPFFFPRPLAPWVDARERGAAQVPLRAVLKRIQEVSKRKKTLLVEGAGGILAPLGEKYGFGEIMMEIGGECLVAAANSLGTINHVLLTVNYLQSIGVKKLGVVMMGQEKPDLSARSNVAAIQALLPKVGVHLVDFLGQNATKVAFVKQNAKYLKKTLAGLVGGANITTVPSNWKGE